MKTGDTFAGLLVALLAVPSAHAQYTFQNLDFESANLSNPSGPFNEVPIIYALPGWTGAIGDDPVTQVWANRFSTGAANISVFGPGWSTIEPGIIDGNYTVFLQSGASPQNSSIGVNVSLSQSGTIPTNAQSLEFKAWNSPPTTAFSVSFDGNILPEVVLSSGQSSSGQPYDVYGININPYAGETGELEFTSIFTSGPSSTEFDDITFSPTAVTPEPSVVALTALGGLLFSARKWLARGGWRRAKTERAESSASCQFCCLRKMDWRLILTTRAGPGG